MQRSSHTFAGSSVDRLAARREDSQWLEARWNEEVTRVVPVWRTRPLIVLGEPGPRIGWVESERVEGIRKAGGERVFLGVREGVAHFALDVSALDDPRDSGPLAGLGKFIDVRSIAPDLEPGEPAILAVARSILEWHARNGYCSGCGCPSRSEAGGFRRDCSACGAERFPRTDPVVIMLVYREDRCLLGRQSRHPVGVFSALAGFLEPGESIEEGVVREVGEEVGLPVVAVRYHSSQPWPFPHSLMIGTLAAAGPGEIELDGQELEEARWFDRDEVRAALVGAAGFRVPPPLAIAHHLIRAWAVESTD